MPTKINPVTEFLGADRPDVREFLGKYPGLSRLLGEARTVIAEFFGEAPVRLRVWPPSDADESQLVAEIVTDLSPEAGLAKLNAFDDEWWLGAVDRAAGKLCINLGTA